MLNFVFCAKSMDGSECEPMLVRSEPSKPVENGQEVPRQGASDMHPRTRRKFRVRVDILLNGTGNCKCFPFCYPLITVKALNFR